MTNDHFSSLAEQYARFRPTYPQDLFDYLGNLATGHSAWDCATGSGQAALGLTPWFQEVWATDLSHAQVEQAPTHPKIRYLCCRAEQTPLPDSSVDLVTVGQAWHWFDAEAFEREAERVLRPRGYLAVWSYNLIKINPLIDQIILNYYHNVVGPYWPAERRTLEQGYPGFPSRLVALPVPQFNMELDWNLDELLGYFSTWSATKGYMEATGDNPLHSLKAELANVWGAEEAKRRVSWPLTLKVARKDI